MDERSMPLEERFRGRNWGFFARYRRYGPENIVRGGLLDVFMRMRDKLERLRTLSGLTPLC